MNPSHLWYRHAALPALALLPLITQFSEAAVIATDPEGNITVSSGNVPASTILASGGTSPSPLVLIQAGAILTGDAGLRVGARVSAPNYSLDNSGFLSGADEGIFVEVAASPTINITNRAAGVIEGGTDGIYFDGNGGTVTNFGIIRGLSGSDGIEGFDNLTVINSGQISGQAGIFADDLLDVTNLSGGTISTVPGSNEAAIEALDFALIDNYGTILSTGAEGIFVADVADIFNSGRIEGATSGILALDFLSVLNEQGGVIIGNSGFGVDAGDDAEIFNDAGAEIRGGFGGISLQDFGYVDNDGSIFGNGGDAIRLGTNGEVFNTGLIDGTTGIVAFNGSVITNSGTIRTNAIGGNAFSGGPGDDDLFLNAGSLIQGNVLGGGGINTITFDGGQTSPTAAVNVIRGSVTDFATITKNGGGLALIGAVADVGSGLSITADVININSGALYFNADITGATVPKTTINAGGAAVGGTGVWNANLNVLANADPAVPPGGFSAGAIPIHLDVNPENAVGAVAITGNVVHSPNTFIRQDIVSDAPIIDGINSDIIEQIGAGFTYNVTGVNLRVASTNVNRVFTPGTYIIIDSDEAIIGFPAFGTVGVQFNANTPDTGIVAQPLQGGTFPADFQNSVLTTRFLTLGLEDGGTNLVMNIDYAFGALPGLTGNAAAFGGALDFQAGLAGTGTLPANQQDFIAALAFSDLAAVQDTLASLNPEGQFALVAGIINSNYRLHRLAENHLANARSGGGQMIQESLPPMTDAKGGMIPGGTTTRMLGGGGRGHVWGSFSYDTQDFESATSIDDFDGETGAFTAGVDYRVAPNFLLGVMLDGSKSDYDYQSASAEVDSFRVAAYGTLGGTMGLYSDFLVGYGRHDLDLRRQLGGIAAGTSSNASADADSFQALLTFGFAMGTEQIKHGPFAGLEYQKVDVDGFTQGGPVPINVDGYDVDSLRGLIGYRVNANMGTFRPYLRSPTPMSSATAPPAPPLPFPAAARSASPERSKTPPSSSAPAPASPLPRPSASISATAGRSPPTATGSTATAAPWASSTRSDLLLAAASHEAVAPPGGGFSIPSTPNKSPDCQAR